MSAGVLPPLVLFDFDGVLVDTEVELFELWRQEYARHDLLLTSDAWAASRRASNWPTLAQAPDVAEALVDRAGQGDVAQTRRRVRQRYEAARDQMRPRAGIVAWIAQCAEGGAECAVVTDAETTVVMDFLHRNALTDQFAFVVSGERGPRKPDPASYRSALSQARRRPEEAIAIEDSVRGIRAARAAGLRVLALPHRATGHTLRPEQGVAVVEPRFMPLDAAILALGTAPVAPPTSNADIERRVHGSMAGLALGDALGKLLDKRPLAAHDQETRAVCSAWKAQRTEPPVIVAGRVTDDTVQSLAIAAVLAAGTVNLRTDVERVLRRMNPHGGRQVYKLKASTTAPPFAADGTTNGAVPRSSALGWRHAPATWGDLIFDAVKVSTLTHAGAGAVGAAVLQALLVSGAVEGIPSQTLVQKVRTVQPSIAAVWADADRHVALWSDEVARVSGLGYRATTLVADLVERHGLSVEANSSALVAQVLAVSGLPPHEVFGALLCTPSGGDLDSTMAIYGSVAGAHDPDAFPAGWSSRTLAWAWEHSGVELPTHYTLIDHLTRLRTAVHG